VSYILDALRKSDLRRRRNTVPTLLTLQPAADPRKRPAYLVYGLIAVALVAAGIVIGWLRPWQSTPGVQRRAEPVGIPSIASKPSASTPIESAQTDSGRRQPAPAASESASPPVAGPSAQAPTPAKPQTDGTPSEAAGAAPGSSAALPIPRVDIGAADAAGETVTTMDKLPPSIRQQLPAMKVSVHAYSRNPGDRLIGIGTRILREGDYVAPGLKLEQITVDGMILSYKGYRFRHGMK
jgi:general secretion pathway protein B